MPVFFFVKVGLVSPFCGSFNDAIDSEIRSSFKTVWAGRLLGWLLRLLGMSLRKEFRGEIRKINEWPSPVIFVLWHNQIGVSPYLWRKMFPKRKCVVLTSASKDGALLASAVSVFRVGAVHGSSSRRATAALIGLKRAAKAGNDLVFTPDGPRGPRYELQPGVIKIAQTTGMLVQPMYIDYQSCWKLKTWDRFRIPKPFSKVILTLGDPLEIPRRLNAEEFESQRADLEASLRVGIGDLLENHGNDH